MEFMETHERRFITRSGMYFGIIFCFVCGAVLGNFCVGWFREQALLVCVALLLISFLMMFVDGEKAAERAEKKGRNR